MTESKRRANIKQIQAHQRRYHAQGRCWCSRAVRHGYKRCDNCIAGYNLRRVKYQEQDRFYCGNRVIPSVKRNGTPYKTCQRFITHADVDRIVYLLISDPLQIHCKFDKSPRDIKGLRFSNLRRQIEPEVTQQPYSQATKRVNRKGVEIYENAILRSYFFSR